MALLWLSSYPDVRARTVGSAWVSAKIWVLARALQESRYWRNHFRRALEKWRVSRARKVLQWSMLRTVALVRALLQTVFEALLLQMLEFLLLLPAPPSLCSQTRAMLQMRYHYEDVSYDVGDW